MESRTADIRADLQNSTQYTDLRQIRSMVEGNRRDLDGLQSDINSTLYLLQDIREQLVGTKQEVGVAVQYLASSCAEIAELLLETAAAVAVYGAG